MASDIHHKSCRSYGDNGRRFRPSNSQLLKMQSGIIVLRRIVRFITLEPCVFHSDVSCTTRRASVNKAAAALPHGRVYAKVALEEP